MQPQKIAVFLNQNAPTSFRRGYQPEDALGEPFVYEDFLSGTPGEACEYAFRLFNAPLEALLPGEQLLAERYRAEHRRSLSVGDVVAVDDVRFCCEDKGFTLI